MPFEGEELPPAIDNPAANRKTTITGSERAAFEKLYKKFNQAEQKGLNEDELDQIADEYYEDDDDNSKDSSAESLDSLFDAALSGKVAPRSTRSSGVTKKPETLETRAKDILHRPEPDEKRRKMKEEAAQKQARIKELRISEKARIRGLLEAAPTDHELWAVLETQVFSVIRSMDLDNSKGSGSSGRKLKAQALAKTSPKSHSSKIDPTRDPAIVYPTYSAHLLSAANTLRNHFPASPLVFNIIPRMKELGRSSYALGASANLYKVVIRAAFRQNHSYTQICSLLQDMDNGGIEYDFGVLQLLNEIIVTHREATIQGHYGRAAQAFLKMDMFAEGLEKLIAWQKVVKRRVGDHSDEKKASGIFVRKADYARDRGANFGGREKVVFGRNNSRSAGGYHRSPLKGDIPLVDGGIPFAEDGAHADKGKQVSAPDAVEQQPYVESFVRDMVDAPVEPPVESSIDATVPPVETPAETSVDTAEGTEVPSSSGSKEAERTDGRAV